jgi:NTE family protein
VLPGSTVVLAATTAKQEAKGEALMNENGSGKVTLVLGGGGGRGLAHIGAWRALQEVGVRPGRIVASSAGALVGACIAAGMSWRELAGRARSLAASSLFAVNPRLLSQGTRSPSLLREEPLRDLIRTILPVSRFGDLDLPLSVNAVALATGRISWFGEDGANDPSLVDALYASCALPLVFPVADIGGESYVDGGLVDPVPVGHARELSTDRIVAVDVGVPTNASESRAGMVDTYCRVLEILRDRSGEALSGSPTEDVAHIRVEAARCHTFDLSRCDALVDAGYRATLQVLTGSSHLPSAESARPVRPAPRRRTTTRLFQIPASIGRFAWAR